VFELDSESADRGGEALVVSDQQAQFDRLAVVERRIDGAPGSVCERAPSEQFVAGGEQRLLTLAQAVRGGGVGQTGDLFGRQPDAESDRYMLVPFVG